MRPSLILRGAAEYLERHGVESSVATAEILLAEVLGADRATLYVREEGLTTSEAKAFGRMLCRRCTGTPVQHLTGIQAFGRLTLEVRPGVFVPRPETEVLAELALDVMSEDEEPIVVDVCTGSGAVALAIAERRPDATVFATDVSPAACELARANASRLGLTVEVHQGSLLDPIPSELRGRVDLVVGNPPYLERDEGLPPEVLADPPEALFGGSELPASLLRAAADWLRPGGAVAVEMAPDQAQFLRAAAGSAGFEEVVVHPDLTGRDRVLIGRLP